MPRTTEEMSISLSAAKNLIARCTQLRTEGKTEAILRAEFQSWLRQVFPDAADEPWVNHYSEGAEAHTKVGTATGTTVNRFVDNLVRSTIIEYEADLRKAGLREHGKEQVREYIAGAVRADTPVSQARGVLSDTVEWHVFDAALTPGVQPRSCTKVDISLHETESFEAVAADNENAFRLASFLKKHLARERSRSLTAGNVATDLGLESLPFRRHLDVLLRLVTSGRTADSSIALATDLWSRFVDGLERGRSGFRAKVYVDEMYIAVLARLLAANVLEANALLSENSALSDILTGRYFTTKFRLKNMVEEDYFGWLLRGPYLSKLLPVAQEIQRDLYAYDFSRLEEEDLFGRLMAQLAERSQRLLLGQEWTPTWVARLLAARCLDSIPKGETPRVVDMCCGSGSILAEVIKEYLRGKKGADLEHLANLVTGFDIDPLAVMLAKTTWVITLASTLKGASEDVIIPIYHADSLFAATPIGEIHDLGDAVAHLTVDLDGKRLELPAELIQPDLRSLFDDLIDWAYDEAKAAAQGKGNSVSAERAAVLIGNLIKKHSVSISEPLRSGIATATFQLANRMADLAKAKRNGIWAFILRNTYRPGLLVGQFNGLVSNPPWLAMSKIGSNPYKAQLSKRSQLYGIKPAGASHLHLELATTYLIHAIDRYLKPSAGVACLVPGTIFKGHHQQKFRDAAYLTSSRSVPFELQQVWEVAPGSFKVRSAAVIGVKRTSSERVHLAIKGFYADQTGLSELPFSVARRDKRTAWVLGSGASSSTGSTSEPVPPQGADLMPRTAVCVEVVEQVGAEWKVETPQPASPLYFAVKDAKQLKGKRFPGFVAPRFLFEMIQSLNLLPFLCKGPFAPVVLPAQRQSGEWKFFDASETRALGYRHTAQRFERIDETIARAKAGKPLAERVDERNKLTIQIFPKNHYLVLSGAGGGIVCGACLAVDDCENAVIDQTLYWRVVPTAMEAWYRVGLLNSDALTEAIRVFNPEGEFGARHPHTLPHRFIAPFDSVNSVHRDIAKLAVALGKHADSIVGDQESLGDPNKTIASRRRKLRGLLRKLSEFERLEELSAVALGTKSIRASRR